MQLKLARKVHGERRCKKNREGLYAVLATGSNIIKVSPTTSTIKESVKAIVSPQNAIAKFGTQQERKTPLRAYADHRGPRTSEKLLGEEVRSQIKEFTRKLKGYKQVNHKRRDVSSSRAAMFQPLDPKSNARCGVSSPKFLISRHLGAKTKHQRRSALRSQR